MLQQRMMQWWQCRMKPPGPGCWRTSKNVAVGGVLMGRTCAHFQCQSPGRSINTSSLHSCSSHLHLWHSGNITICGGHVPTRQTSRELITNVHPGSWRMPVIPRWKQLSDIFVYFQNVSWPGKLTYLRIVMLMLHRPQEVNCHVAACECVKCQWRQHTWHHQVVLTISWRLSSLLLN